MDVKPKGQGDAASVRCYEVPATYGSKSDAKIAVAYLAAQQGVIDFLRRGGEPLPPSEAPAFSCLDGQPRLAPNTTTSVESRSSKKKRKKKEKEDAGDEGPPAKKQKTAHVLPQKPGGGAGAASLPKKPDQGRSQRSTSSSSFTRADEAYSGSVGVQPAPQVAGSSSHTAAPAPSHSGDLRERRSPSLEEGEWPEDELWQHLSG